MEALNCTPDANRTHLRARGHARKNSKSIVREIGSPEIPVRDRYLRLYPGDPEKGERSSLFRVLARTPFNSCVRPTFFSKPLLCSARLRPAAAGSRRVGGRSCSQRSTCHRPARGPFAARLDARALRWSCARTPKSGLLVPVQRPTDGAECARVLCRWCGGEGADAARRAAKPAPNVVPRPAA